MPLVSDASSKVVETALHAVAASAAAAPFLLVHACEHPDMLEILTIFHLNE